VAAPTAGFEFNGRPAWALVFGAVGVATACGFGGLATAGLAGLATSGVTGWFAASAPAGGLRARRWTGALAGLVVAAAVFGVVVASASCGVAGVVGGVAAACGLRAARTALAWPA